MWNSEDKEKGPRIETGYAERFLFKLTETSAMQIFHFQFPLFLTVAFTFGPHCELAAQATVEAQPLLLQVNRLAEALQYLGNPLPDSTREQLKALHREVDEKNVAAKVMALLDPLCLAEVNISPESRVSARTGSAAPNLVEQGWRQFLIKVNNRAGVTAALNVQSEQATPVPKSPAEKVRDRWMELKIYRDRPLNPTLSGLALEYRIVQIYSRDAGKRAAVLEFDVGQGTQDLGFRSDLSVTFNIRPSQPLTLKLRDENGEPCMASLEIRDRQQRVYPSQAKRLAPDFAFHPQIYRADGESVRLPPGDYRISVRRGPEVLPRQVQLLMTNQPQTLELQLKRWVDPAASGWYSGDHHIHAAGCKHYDKPSEGVLAEDMMRHCLGEDLKVGANLTWGPCFDYQKQFFTGKDDKVSRPPYLFRYDVEVSGFGSHRSGHLCLLGLKEQIYPGGDSKHHWPTLCLNTLRWAKKQGAVCGPAHSGWGLKVPGNTIPSPELPPYDGIGANEYIVDVTHQVEGPDGKPVPAVDFMSLVDTPSVWELTMWYHTLNCGFKTRVSGETDFPCIYGERVGLGRSYVKVDGKLSYEAWIEGIRTGRAYVSDGMSHLMNFRVNDVALGGKEVKLEASGTVTASCEVAARLPEKAEEKFRNLPLDHKPYWHLERARIGDSREVALELIVNGTSVETKQVKADGTRHPVSFDTRITQSSWVALRIFPSSHTNPIWVSVGGKPVRASLASARWCQAGVEKCWEQKEKFIAEKEMDDAIAAYNHARKIYRQIVRETRESGQ